MDLGSFPWRGYRLDLTDRTSRVKGSSRTPCWERKHKGRAPVLHSGPGSAEHTLAKCGSIGLSMHPGPQTLQCWAWVQLVLGTEESWGLEFLRGRRNCKEEALRRQIVGQLRTELGVPVFDVDVLISINANSPSLEQLLLNVIFPWMWFNTGQTSGMKQEATPPTGGSLAPAPLPTRQLKSGF